MTELAVGKPYPNPEMVAAESAGWHLPVTILEATPGLTPERARQEWDGARLWLVTHGPVLVLLAKLDDRTLEMPTYLPAGDELPEWVHGGPGRLAFTIVSVDSTTGAVVRLRQATVSDHFTATLRKEAARTLRPLDDAAAVAAITAYQDRYLTVPDAQKAAVVTSLLGEVR